MTVKVGKKKFVFGPNTTWQHQIMFSIFMTLASVLGDKFSYLFGKLLGEYHQNETLKRLYIWR